MPMTALNGLRFHYQQKGHGEDVVLLHAVTSNMSMWLFSNLMDVIAQDFRVTAYDLAWPRGQRCAGERLHLRRHGARLARSL